MSQKFKVILFRSAYLLFVLVLFDIISGKILNILYSKSKYGVSYQEYYIINRTSQDVLILGSSRAAFHYVPEIFEDELNLTVYNAGREGTGKYYQYGVFLATLHRYKPKKIILDFDYREIYDHEGFDERDLDELIPFYGKISDQFDSLLINRWYKKILYKSNLLKYNKKVFHILTGNLFKGQDNINGYRPLYGTWEEPITILNTEQLVISNEKVNVIRKLVEAALANDVEVCLVASPYFKCVPDNFLYPLNDLAEEFNIDFLNFISDTTFLNNPFLYFNEELHLNDTGARQFSKMIAQEINHFL